MDNKNRDISNKIDDGIKEGAKYFLLGMGSVPSFFLRDMTLSYLVKNQQTITKIIPADYYNNKNRCVEAWAVNKDSENQQRENESISVSSVKKQASPTYIIDSSNTKDNITVNTKNLTEEQQNFAVTLKPGEAIVFDDSLNEPIMYKFERIPDTDVKKNWTRNRISLIIMLINAFFMSDDSIDNVFLSNHTNK